MFPTQIPLISLLLGTVVLAIFDTVGLFWGLYRGAVPSGSHASWCRESGASSSRDPS